MKPQPEGKDLLIEVLEVTTEDEFRRFLAENPNLLSKAQLAELRQMSEDPVAGPAFAALDELLQGAARGDPGEAWRKYQQRIQQATEQGAAFDAGFKAAERALADRDSGLAIERCTALLPAVHDAGLIIMESLLYEVRAKAFLLHREGDHAANLEMAIGDFREAVMRAADETHRAMVLMHAGIAFRERVFGDRARNVAQATELFREAMKLLDDSAAPELWALLRTNLASTLLSYEGDGRQEYLREAATLCEAAFQYRTLERNAVDWAYTKTNYGFIQQDLAALGDGDVSEAKETFAEVISQSARISEKWLVGSAHCALGRIERLAAERSGEERMAAESVVEEERQRREDIGHLELARRHLETGLALTGDDPLPIRRGRALDDLAAVLTQLELPHEAIPVGRKALAIMGPTTAPRECLSIGGRLGDQLAEEGQWAEAAAAFSAALEAAELSFHGRLETAAREQEARRAGELARWAAMAFAQVGMQREAAVALESGRTRELRRRLGLREPEERRLEGLPPQLREKFVAASAALGSSPLDDSAYGAGEVLQEVLEKIRHLPGMRDFATGPRWEDLAAAVDERWPLVYVNPTPWGTLFLRIAQAGEAVEADTLVLERPTSLDVYNRLALGAALDPDAPAGLTPASYLAGVAAEKGANLRAGLEQALPWLGEKLCEPLGRWLGNQRVTLVPCGPISTAPLGAAPWEAGGAELCLLDCFAVRYAPSALVAARARGRAALQSSELQLLALADPDRSLDAAGPEVEEIASHFGGRATIARGAEATAEFLRAEVSGATYLHLACHAEAGIFDTTDAGICLADGLLPASKLPELSCSSIRLAVISACQSALPEIARLPNEVFAISTALLAAGSACVVASLWPVDDCATAILMTRFYEEIFNGGHDPAEGLRRAQLWLRDLANHDKAAFLAAHPLLAAEIRRRRSGEQRGRAKGTGRPGHPYSHPNYWSPFICVGA